MINTGEEISPKDNVSIPIIDVDISTKYLEISKRQAYFNSKPIHLDSIKENMCFKLNNEGTILKSEIEISGRYNCVFDEPKNLIFNDSFVVYLKQKESSSPYFAGFFNDAKFLKEYSKPFISDTNAKIVDLYNTY
jgi:hypothetical protein